MTVGQLRELLNTGRFNDDTLLSVGVCGLTGTLLLGALDGLYLCVGVEGADKLALLVREKPALLALRVYSEPDSAEQEHDGA